MELQADIVTFEPCDDEFIAYAFFRAGKASDKHYLAISRSLEPGNEGDVVLELDDQSRQANDGILEWKLDENRLTLCIESRAAKDLGIVGDPIIVVDFAMNRDAREGLERTLSAILGDGLEAGSRPGRAKVSGTR